MDLDKLKEAMLERGYTVDNLKTDGQYHRFEIQGSKGQPGYYIIRASAAGLIAVYGDFVSGKKHRWTSGNNSQALTPGEAKKLKKQLAKEAEDLEAKIKRKHEKGAMAASFFWSSGEDFQSHEYLETKEVKSYGLKRCTLGRYAGWLMVPGYNDTGELVTVQYIDRDGQKYFETGGKTAGAFFKIPGTDDKLIIAEGYSTASSIHEATGQTVIVAFTAGNMPHVAKLIRDKHPNAEIILAADNDVWKPEKGNTGVDSAKNAAIEIDAKLAIPEFKDTETKPTDFNDLAVLDGIEAVRAQIEAATAIDKAEALRAEINELAGRDMASRAVGIRPLSKKYGVSVSDIRAMLKVVVGDSDKGLDPIVKDIEPFDGPVDGAQILDGILAELNDRVILPDGAAEAVTLWVALTYCYDAVETLPMLGVTSPDPECGKSTTFIVIELFANKAVIFNNATGPTLFRTIEKYRPTMLLDDAENYTKDNKDLFSIIDSGHRRRTAWVPRTVGDDHEPKRFSTWCPKAIGMIGRIEYLSKPMASRCIHIRMQRKKPDEITNEPEQDLYEEKSITRAMLKRWAVDNFDRIKTDYEANRKDRTLALGSSRKNNNWYPLLTIADAVGGQWPERVRYSIEAMQKTEHTLSRGVQLLSDIKRIFEANGAEAMRSEGLTDALNSLDESPWAACSRDGSPLTMKGLSSRLGEYGIKPNVIWLNNKAERGYKFEWFKDSFERYIPPSNSGFPSVRVQGCNDINGLEQKQSVRGTDNLTLEKRHNHLKSNDSYTITLETPENGGQVEKLECYGCTACDKSTMMCHSATMFEGKSGGAVLCGVAIKTCQYNKE